MTDTTDNTITITDADVETELARFGDYAPTVESLVDGGYLDAIKSILALEAEEDSWTWLDNDPDVAWRADEDEHTFHGRLRDIYASVGWEGCYHGYGRDGRFRFNVKLNGSGAYRAFNAKIDETDKARGGLLDRDEVDSISQILEEDELRSWWEDVLPDDGSNYANASGPRYSCGRSGGYVTMPRADERNGAGMVLMAQNLAGSRAYYNGAEWGEYLADMAIERYDEAKLDELASPRVSMTW